MKESEAQPEIEKNGKKRKNAKMIKMRITLTYYYCTVSALNANCYSFPLLIFISLHFCWPCAIFSTKLLSLLVKQSRRCLPPSPGALVSFSPRPVPRCGAEVSRHCLTVARFECLINDFRRLMIASSLVRAIYSTYRSSSVSPSVRRTRRTARDAPEITIENKSHSKSTCK